MQSAWKLLSDRETSYSLGLETTLKKTALLGLALASFGFAGVSHAIPFNLTAQLTGDPRVANPDGIVVDVSIVGDTDFNFVDWLVDLNSPLHPQATLGVFAFSVTGLFADYSFSLFTPTGWSITGGNNVPGSGGADFLFETNDPAGPVNNVTNAVDLTFRMTNNLGNFTVDHFLASLQACSNDTDLGCGQLGAHVRSLGTNGNGSGFALGNYGGGGGTPVPEPTALALLGLGLLGVGFARRKRG